MKVINNNRGAALVFAALFLTVMFLFIGIAIDIGWMTYVKNQGQAAVDAAALAGASALPNETEVYNRVAAFNGKNTVIDSDQNHLGSSNVTFITYDGTNITNEDADPEFANGIRVAMEGESDSAIQTPFFFSVWRRFFGGTASGSANVNVSAIAVVPSKPSLPVALLGCEAGAQDFKFSQTPDTTDTSGFTSFTVQSANTNILRDMVNDPNLIPPIEPNESSICLINGQATPVLTEIEQKYSPFTPSSCFIVPVFDDRDIQPNQCRVFQRFAKICITDVVNGGPEEPGEKYIQANVESCDAPPWIIPVTAAGRPILIK